MTFGAKLRELRTKKGLTQKELAAAAGLQQSAIARWESDQQVPTFAAVHAICQALGIKCAAFETCDFADTQPKPKRGAKKI